ncbi:uncharacterized protein DS421_8g251040 [Arachis hypogaea]|nr:uncharacterized protein DS421_8g251040 [Arachis hypogaea]
MVVDTGILMTLRSDIMAVTSSTFGYMIKEKKTRSMQTMEKKTSSMIRKLPQKRKMMNRQRKKMMTLNKIKLSFYFVTLSNQSLPVKGGLWKDICQLNINEQRVRDKIVNGLAMEVGNGRKTRFWEDNWVQGGSLRVHFPRLFSVSSQQNFVIGDCGFWDGLEWIWNFQWRRELFQWELELVHQLHERLRPVRMSLENEDAVVWKFDNTGVFSTKSFLQIIQTETLSEEITSYSFTRAIWKGLVPPRIELFGWFVLVGRINTKERLNRLGVDIHSDTICVLCHKGCLGYPWNHERSFWELDWHARQKTRIETVDGGVLCSNLEHMVGTECQNFQECTRKY